MGGIPGKLETIEREGAEAREGGKRNDGCPYIFQRPGVEYGNEYWSIRLHSKLVDKEGFLKDRVLNLHEKLRNAAPMEPECW